MKTLKTIWWRLKSILARIYYNNPAKKLKIIGVTGTSGKTTTTTLLYKIAKELGFKVGLIGTNEILIDGKKFSEDDGSARPGTTPDSVTLTKILHRMVESGCEYVFMEVSSHAMAQNRVAGINFIGGIFTNFSQDHLDYHKTMEDYFQAKKKFFYMLGRRSFALTNIDDKNGFRIIKGIQANPFFYGFEQDFEKVQFHGKINKLDFNGLDLTFNNINLKSRLLGKFNAYNLLSVWSACSLLGFEMDKVNKIIENIEPPRGRFEHFTSKSGVLNIVDYAHKPDALEKIFSAIQDVGGGNGSPRPDGRGKLISVFGCGGDRDISKRPIMGKIGAMNSDIAIFTSDNPRSEDPDEIIKQMQTSLSNEDLKKVLTIPNRHEAIKKAVSLAQGGDIILVAGKGHEDYQIIKEVKTHFDDREELEKAYAK